MFFILKPIADRVIWCKFLTPIKVGTALLGPLTNIDFSDFWPPS